MPRLRVEFWKNDDVVKFVVDEVRRHRYTVHCIDDGEVVAYLPYDTINHIVADNLEPEG